MVIARRLGSPIVLAALLASGLTLGSARRAPAAAVQPPVLVKRIQWTGTAWFGSPMVHALGGGPRKIIGTFYSIYVWDGDGNELDHVPLGSRIYAPAVVADLEGDGVFEIVAGCADQVVAYEWRGGRLQAKSGWPASVCSAGECPEVRGLAAGDLDRDGSVEIVATTTQTQPDGAQVFVFAAGGSLYQPPGLAFQAWPRYNTATGPGNDADANGPGNHGYGCYGLNVGIGDLDDDPELEIVVTFDNHQINVFEHTGVSKLASPYFTNRSSQYSGNRLNWGQFIRWFDDVVEHDHYHLHTGDWPHPVSQKWMQWTASPPSVADLNGDRRNEVVAVANVEMDVPYDTKHHAIMVLEGDYGSGDRSARRLAGWETLPSSDEPLGRDGLTWYPPQNPPAPTLVDIDGDRSLEILYAAHDGYLNCTSARGERLWRHDLELPVQGTNGNGKGAPAAPTVMDANGDGTLEILVQTFGAGFFIYTVPGSAENLLPWPTARGGFLRDGRMTNRERGAALAPALLLLGGLP